MPTPPQQPLSPAHANTILDSIADGVFTVDEKMRITYFNHAAERITGVARREAIGQTCAPVLRANVCEITCSLRSSFETVTKSEHGIYTKGKKAILIVEW